MTIPVCVPDWQIGDGDIEPPFIGLALRHVLLITTPSEENTDYYGQFGIETTVTGVAEHLTTHTWHTAGTVPIAVRCEGFTLYWEAADWRSPHTSMTVAVLHLDVSEEAVAAAVGRESVSSKKGTGLGWRA